LAINFIFTVPLLVFLIENEKFLKIDSFFELSTIITIKLLLIFNKSLNFLEVLTSAILLNLFDIFFTKKYYLNNDESLSEETKDKNIRKLNQFRFNFKFLLTGYIINGLWFLMISNNLRFHFLDESNLL